ncbi:hypothetical protein ZOSMA_201G00270 [Zostera marina]|uniref:Uncharacterized protein n=1 Tax=Zostera marina TaxID=29655 RepID=A0A0K9PP28_ZOSMR|nr:hypothetical protein ZOSMA_201G00270 [Zostera marina]
MDIKRQEQNIQELIHLVITAYIPAPSFDLLDEKYSENNDITLEKSLTKDRCRTLEEIECNLADILDTPPRKLHKLYTSELIDVFLRIVHGEMEDFAGVDKEKWINGNDRAPFHFVRTDIFNDTDVSGIVRGFSEEAEGVRQRRFERVV